MFEIQLPDGFTHMKQVSIHIEYWKGFSYSIELLSIIQNAEGTLFLRKYTNSCDVGANGRPVTSIRDVCFKISGKVHISGINERNWRKFISDNEYQPSVIIENAGGDYVDQKVLDYVKENF